MMAKPYKWEREGGGGKKEGDKDCGLGGGELQEICV